MTEQEQIEEMAQIIFNSKYKNDYISPLKGANELYNAGYRKIPENAVVITNEEYQMLKQLEKHHITCEDVYEYVELARKETREKFLNMIYWRAVKHIKGNNKDECFIEISFEKLDELAKQFGVEVEE